MSNNPGEMEGCSLSNLACSPNPEVTHCPAASIERASFTREEPQDVYEMLKFPDARHYYHHK